jgi:hypothetical protein
LATTFLWPVAKLHPGAFGAQESDAMVLKDLAGSHDLSSFAIAFPSWIGPSNILRYPRRFRRRLRIVLRGLVRRSHHPRHLHRESERLREPYQIDLAPTSCLLEDMNKVGFHSAGGNAEQR